jgi:hypothetical protein
MSKNKTMFTQTNQPAPKSDAPVEETVTSTKEVVEDSIAAPEVVQESPAVNEPVSTEVKPTAEEPPMQSPEVATEVPISDKLGVEASLFNISVPDDISGEVKPEFITFLNEFNPLASESTKSWANAVLNSGVKFKSKRPIDIKGCYECTQFALSTMRNSIMAPLEMQQRMRFVRACFKHLTVIFSPELLARGADQLNDSQYKQYTALVNMYMIWAEHDDPKEISNRVKVNKTIMEAFGDHAIAQRVSTVLGI